MKLLITGFGTIVPGSCENHILWENLKGKNNLFQIYENYIGNKMLVGRQIEYDRSSYPIEPKKFNYLDKQMIYSLMSCKECIETAKLQQILQDEKMAEKVGILSGSMFAQLEFGLEQVKKVELSRSTRISPYTGMAFYYGSNVGEISCMLRSKGENCGIISGSSSGIDGIAIAKQMLEEGRNNYFLIGAGENVTYDVFAYALDKYKKVADQQYKPYSRGRNGASISNGAAIFCLEEEETALQRNVHVYAEIKAVKTKNAWQCFEKISEEIIPYYVKVIIECIREAGMETKDIDLIIPTAEGSEQGDYYECMALAGIFSGRRNIIYSPKPVVGYTISFNTIIDMFTAAKCMEENLIPGMPYKVDTGNKDWDSLFVGTEEVHKRIRNVLILHRSWTDGKISGVILKKYEDY